MEGEGKGEPPDWMSDPGPIVSPVDAGEKDRTVWSVASTDYCHPFSGDLWRVGSKLVRKKNFCNFLKKDTELQVPLNLLTQNIYSFCYFDNWKYSSTSLICFSAFFVSVFWCTEVLSTDVTQPTRSMWLFMFWKIFFVFFLENYYHISHCTTLNVFFTVWIVTQIPVSVKLLEIILRCHKTLSKKSRKSGDEANCFRLFVMFQDLEPLYFNCHQFPCIFLFACWTWKCQYLAISG